MKTFKLLTAALVASFLGLAVSFTPASALSNTKLDMIQDCSAGCVEAIDMAGPTGFGFINYNQDDTGDLRVVASLKNAAPNATYHIYLVCGPTHATACGFIDIGTLTTNSQGNGNSAAVVVPLATLQAAPFGAGDRTDHIDLIQDTGLGGGLYAVTGVNYTVAP